MAGKIRLIDGQNYHQVHFAIRGRASDPDSWQLPHHRAGQGDLAHDRLRVDWPMVQEAVVAVEAGLLEGSDGLRQLAALHLADHYRKARKRVPKGLAEILNPQAGRVLPLVDRGAPLLEMVKGSKEYTLQLIRDAFRAQFSTDSDRDWWPYIVETFSDYVIVRAEGLAIDEYWLVVYTIESEIITFVPEEEWIKVELAYQVSEIDIEESRSGQLGQAGEVHKFRDQSSMAVTLEEAVQGGPRYISGIGYTADVTNGNGRLYPSALLKGAVEAAQAHLQESLSQGRLYVMGEAEHPSQKGTKRPQFLETLVKWESITFDESANQVLIRGRILETAKGKDAIAIMEGGILPAISARGYGKGVQVEADGQSYEQITELTITGFDLLSPGQQSDPNGGITLFESKRPNRRVTEMDFNEILEALRQEGILDGLTEAIVERVQEAQAAATEAQRMENLRGALGAAEGEDLVEAARRLATAGTQSPLDPSDLESQLREDLGIADTADVAETIAASQERLAELEEAEVQRGIASYVEEQVAALPYPVWLREKLANVIGLAKPGTVEEAKTLIVSKRKEYDEIMSKFTLAMNGHEHGVAVLGPVLEREAGVPEFARGAWEITEALIKTGMVQEARNLSTPRNVNERFAAQYLEKFDKQYMHYLKAESRLLAEAEQASDLNLPYSVTRAIVAEAFPRLIATSVFDVGMTEQSETRVYYEAYAAESGLVVAITDEDVTSDEGAWVSLANNNITPGTVVVDPDGGGTDYVEGTDYVIDYRNGKLWTIAAAAGGTIGDATALDVDYSYTRIRAGEMVAIERAKGTLSYTTLSMAADRLATQISSEAVTFSRSQIGWDATARTLNMLIREIQRKIDRGLLEMALAAALIQASNSGGTWVAASDPVTELVEKIGVARVLVGNRYYEPTSILMSLTNSDRVANWDGFTAAGARADGMLNANGLVGRLKGLPVFESTEIRDAYITVVNREIVMHRVLTPMSLKGPFPSYDATSLELVAADQYFAEEYNGSDAPVPEKAAYVKIT